MDYFKAISFRASQLDDLANAYLSKLPFLSNDQVLEKLWSKAKEIWKQNGSDFNGKSPEWVENWMDGWIPYSTPQNGSLYFSLGWSVASQDAHLRNLLERAEGRETKELDFAILAEKEIVDKLVLV